MGAKSKKNENMQKQQFYECWEQSRQAGVENGAMLTTF